MRIACPACAAEYEVPEDRVPPGKVVRCARCGTDWVPVERAPEPLAPREVFAPASFAPLAVQSQESYVEPPPERRRPALAVAWVLSIAVLAAAVWGAYAKRADVVLLWPASERVYMALGIPIRT